MKMSFLPLVTVAVAISVFSQPGLVRATPYASSLTNNGSQISFRLNESAESVRIIYDGGASVIDLGARSAGLITTNVAIAGAFQVEVFKNGGLGYLHGVAQQISSDANAQVRFNSPRGVAVNRDPASPYFGRIYVANSDAGTTTSPARTLGDGIYVLNADYSDAVGQGNTARTGGLVFTNNDSANHPFRLEVGQDGNLYISSYSTNSGNLYVSDPNVSDGSGTNVFEPGLEAGRFPSSAIATGSLANGDLAVLGIYPDKEYTYDFLGTPATSFSVVQRWTVGAGPLPATVPAVRATDLPILVADVPSVLSDLDVAPDGRIYVNQFRSDGFEGGLFVVDPTKDVDGSGFPDIVFNSYATSLVELGATNDLLRLSRGVKVSPDGTIVALVRDDSRTYILQIVNGLPDMNSRRLVDTGTTSSGRDVAFDAAGNLYVATSGHSALRVFSPGYPARATTGSDGTFNLVRMTGNAVTLTMTDTNLNESGDAGAFTITRTGNTSAALSVNLTYSGTAGFNVDYSAPTNVTIPAGESTATVIVTPVDDGFGEPLETITATVTTSTNYFIAGAYSGTLFLEDNNDPPSLAITALDTNLYERMPGDSGRFVLIRQASDISVPMDASFSLEGTAVAGTDYQSLVTAVTFGPNVTRITNALVPIDNDLLDGTRTIVVTLNPSGDYTLVPGSTVANFTLRDDEQAPTAPVLFSEDFDADHSANYNIRFGADNGVDDKIVDFNFDYSTRGIASAPHSTGGTTRGLKVTVNKDATASAAGVNVYPAGVTFSNNYALRFDMFLTFSSAVAGTTEHAIFGLNHSGLQTNRHAAAGSDGVWFAVETDGSGSGGGRSYVLYTATNQTTAPPFTNRTAATFDTFFTSPPFIGVPSGAPSGQWVDVEVVQTNNNLTWKINDVTIMTRTNASAFTSGTFMVGHMDSFSSVGSVNNFTVFDNIRVVDLGGGPAPRPVITAVRSNAGTIEIDFTGEAGGTYSLESSTDLPGGFGPDAGSSVTSLGGTSFRATSPNSGSPARFFQVRGD